MDAAHGFNKGGMFHSVPLLSTSTERAIITLTLFHTTFPERHNQPV